MAEQDAVSTSTPPSARRSSPLLRGLTSNPLLLFVLLSSLGTGGVSIASLSTRPSEEEIRDQVKRDIEAEAAEQRVRSEVVALGPRLDTIDKRLSELETGVAGCNRRGDEHFAFQGEIYEEMGKAFGIFGRALKVDPPPTSAAAEDLRRRALSRYQSLRLREEDN